MYIYVKQMGHAHAKRKPAAAHNPPFQYRQILISHSSAMAVEPAPPPLRVAIIGGGIGGLTASLFLNHACRERVVIDVYERAGEFKEIGNGVGLGVNAAKLLRKIGIYEACEEIAGNTDDIWFTFCRGDTGGEITQIMMPVTKDVKQVSMARSEFLDVLLGFVGDRKAAGLHTNKKCVEIKVRLTHPSARCFTETQTKLTGTRTSVGRSRYPSRMARR